MPPPPLWTPTLLVDRYIQINPVPTKSDHAGCKTRLRHKAKGMSAGKPNLSELD